MKNRTILCGKKATKIRQCTAHQIPNRKKRIRHTSEKKSLTLKEEYENFSKNHICCFNFNFFTFALGIILIQFIPSNLSIWKTILILYLFIVNLSLTIKKKDNNKYEK